MGRLRTFSGNDRQLQGIFPKFALLGHRKLWRQWHALEKVDVGNALFPCVTSRSEE